MHRTEDDGCTPGMACTGVGIILTGGSRIATVYPIGISQILVVVVVIDMRLC